MNSQQTEPNKDPDTRFNPLEIEKKWTAIWDQGQFWRADELSDKPSFCMVMPPPNITGELHMGHALTVSIEDCIARYKRMTGFEVLFVPGLDHAGIATQTVVERNLWKESGETRQQIGREKFTKRLWQWKDDHQNEILNQIKRLGASCDWSRLCFSLDETRCKAVQTAFKTLFDRGLIYQGHYMVNWDPVAQTALSDDEVEHEERRSTLWQLSYKLVDKTISAPLIVATTRPETLLGDVALAVHPDDSRYSHLVGTQALVPLIDRPIPIIADKAVDPEFGTGVVKITPAHDPLDYQIGQRHHLLSIEVISENGIINPPSDAAHLSLGGMSVDRARVQICLDLQKGGHLVSSKPHFHRVGISYRSKAVIEPRLSQQWFFKLSAFRKDLREAIQKDEIDLIPQSHRATYFHWVDGLRDWCISRQLWWGHRIPIWKNHLTNEVICLSFGQTPPGGEMWKQEDDVLDTWFSSALWPLSALNWPDSSLLLDRFYPNALLETGCDILFFWVARMAIMGKLLAGKWPFKTCYLHGLIYAKSYWRTGENGNIAYVADQERLSFDLGKRLPQDVSSKWEKMSKSKQNVINPNQITSKYGVDATRFALLSSITKLGQIDLDLRKFDESRNFTNKLWNASRFVLMALRTSPEMSHLNFSQRLDPKLLLLEDRWILARLRQLIANYHHHFDELDLNLASDATYDFFWNEFCAHYIEIAKTHLLHKESEQRRVKQKILALVLLASVRLLHPMLPFVTEEIFALLKGQVNGSCPDFDQDPITKEACSAITAPCCMASSIPRFEPPTPNELSEIEEFQFLMRLVRVMRNQRAKSQLSKGAKLRAFIICSDKCWSNIERHLKLIESLDQKTTLERILKEPKMLCGFASIDQTQVYFPISQDFKKMEIERIDRELTKNRADSAQLVTMLDNAEFRAKAPNQLICQKQDQLNTLRKNQTALKLMHQRLSDHKMID